MVTDRFSGERTCVRRNGIDIVKNKIKICVCVRACVCLDVEKFICIEKHYLLQKMNCRQTVKQLREIAKNRGVKTSPRILKAELCSLLQEYLPPAQHNTKRLKPKTTDLNGYLIVATSYFGASRGVPVFVDINDRDGIRLHVSINAKITLDDSQPTQALLISKEFTGGEVHTGSVSLQQGKVYFNHVPTGGDVVDYFRYPRVGQNTD